MGASLTGLEGGAKLHGTVELAMRCTVDVAGTYQKRWARHHCCWHWRGWLGAEGR